MGPVKRDEPPPKAYTVYVTDELNEVQVEQTRIWLETLVKDKSKIRAMKGFPTGDAEPPWDELEQFVHDADVWEQKLDAYEITLGWRGVLLDVAGYDAVLGKKEWIASIDDPSRYRVVEC
jgi:hypothetical protein